MELWTEKAIGYSELGMIFSGSLKILGTEKWAVNEDP